MSGAKRKSEDSQQAPWSPPSTSPTSASSPVSSPQRLSAGVIQLKHKGFTVHLPPTWITAFEDKQSLDAIRNPGKTFCSRLWGKANLKDTDYGFLADEELLARRFLPFTGGRLLIRQEYDLMYQRAEDMYRRFPMCGVVVTGQPGVGKTASITYIVARHLSERRIIAVFLAGELFLFTEEGVFTHANPSLARANYDLNTGLPLKHCPWLLIDASSEKHKPPPDSLVRSPKIFPLHLTSPDEDRYKGWLKQREGIILIMDPWTEDELRDGLALQSFFQDANPGQQEAYLNKLSDIIGQYGYAARDIYGTLAGRKKLDIAILDALKEFTSYKQLMNLKTVMALAHIKADAICHQLVTVERSKVPVTSPTESDTAVLKPKSPYVGGLVSYWVARAQYVKTKDFLRLLRAFPQSNTLAGWIFEGAVLHILARSPDVPTDILAAIPPISPMVRIRPPTNRAIFQHVPAPDAPDTPDAPDAPDELFEVLTVGDEPTDEEPADDEPTDVDAGVPQVSLSLPELAGMLYYDNIRDVPTNTKQLFVPSTPSNPLFDGLFIDHTATPKILWVCQVTIAKTHKGSDQGYAQINNYEQNHATEAGSQAEQRWMIIEANDYRLSAPPDVSIYCSTAQSSAFPSQIMRRGSTAKRCLHEYSLADWVRHTHVDPADESEYEVPPTVAADWFRLFARSVGHGAAY
ncbi:hypothetical protein FA95DRAFT_1593744 [Auriscalpium vulgare]|uniref:Uncharacterized protein n=1 Tax=Auriscalpium vulgare TaxID=40419 RepID=A0ACB8S4L9_9AGAM|nr:hypothetical protein FA95DRAFT_1593744 [Auriscalpium vulgare]